MGKGEGTEIEVSHHWSMIRSICLFSETSLKIQNTGIQRAFGTVQKEVIWGCSSNQGMEALHISTPPSPYRSPPFHSFWVLSCTWIENSKSFPEISHQFYWLLCVEVGSRKLSFLVTWSEAWVTSDHMAGFWREDSLDPPTCGISPNSTDFVSEVN